jgi:hypothetical protein
MTRSKTLTLKPEWEKIENARNAGDQFLTQAGVSADKVQAVTMVISELIENAIKYGNYAYSRDEITASIRVDEKLITVEVHHPVEEGSYNHLEKLDSSIQWIRGFQNPFEAYIEKVQEISKKPFNDHESGLGLARIAYEGQSILDFFLNENNQLSVSAVTGC